MKRKWRNFLIDSSCGYEWVAILVMPRTKENWMIAELDRYLDEVVIDNSSTEIVRGQTYCYITVWAEILEDLPRDLIKVSADLRRACTKSRRSISSVFGWCDFMSITEFSLHDRKMAERCFGVRAVRKQLDLKAPTSKRKPQVETAVTPAKSRVKMP